MLRFDASAARYANEYVEDARDVSFSQVAEFYADGTIYIDARAFDWPSPIEGWKVEAVVAHLFKDGLVAQLLYSVMLSCGSQIDYISVPCALSASSVAEADEWRRSLMLALRLGAEDIGSHMELRGEAAWLDITPRVGALLALLAGDAFAYAFDYLADEGVIYLEAMLPEEAERRMTAVEEAAEAKCEASDSEENDEGALHSSMPEESSCRQEQAAVSALGNTDESALGQSAESAGAVGQLLAVEPSLEEQLAAAEAHIAELKSAPSAERDRVSRLEHKSLSLAHGLAASKAAAKKHGAAHDAQAVRGELFDALDLPQTVAASLDLTARVWPDRLVVALEARKSAQTFSDGDAAEAWAALRDAATILYGLIFSDESTDDKNRFKERSRFEVALGESPQTDANAQLMRLRQLSFEGKMLDMQAHVKGKTRNGRALRIHFAIDHERERLIIGHCGNHLPTASDR